MKYYIGLGKSHPSGAVRFLKGVKYPVTIFGRVRDDKGSGWEEEQMEALVKKGLVAKQRAIEENE